MKRCILIIVLFCTAAAFISCQKKDVSPAHALDLSFERQGGYVLFAATVASDDEKYTITSQGTTVNDAHKDLKEKSENCYMKTIKEYRFYSNLYDKDVKEILTLIYNDASFPLDADAIHDSIREKLHIFANTILQEAK